MKKLIVTGVHLVCLISLIAFPQSAFAQTQEIFSYNFTGVNGVPSGWSSNIDGSVGCTGFPASSNDAAIYVVGSTSWPGHGQVLTNIANYNEEYGTTVNSIGTRNFDYVNGGTYRVDTDMRLWRTDGNYKADHLGINLTFTSYNPSLNTYVEHFAEVNIETNPNDPNYGYLMYRKNINENIVPPWGDASNWQRTQIANVGVNTNWHDLIVNVWADHSAQLYKLVSVYFGGQWYTIDKNLATRVTAPDRQYQHSLLMLETANAYTGCSGSVKHIGVGLYDNVKLEYDPW